MDLVIGVAVGSSMQIALLVLPLIVVLGWIIGESIQTALIPCPTKLTATNQASILWYGIPRKHARVDCSRY